MDTSKTKTPYGGWRSPITADMVAGKALRFGCLQTEGETLYWTEGRPQEQGRMTVMRQRYPHPAREMTSQPYAARSRIHEYGGGEFLALNGAVYFVNTEDQNIYMATSGAVTALTEVSGYRFADFSYDRMRRRLIAVAERHGPEESTDPKNMLVAIPLDGRARGYITPLAEGADFYANPRVSPDGSSIAWVEWDLPGMPWDESRLSVGVFASNGEISSLLHLAGGSGTSVFQPEWIGPDLVFVDDRSGWGNLYRWDGTEVQAIAPREAEFGLPLWALGVRSYTSIGGNRLFSTFFENGASKAAIVDVTTGAVDLLDLGFKDIVNPSFALSTVFAYATSDTMPRALVKIPIGEHVPAPSVHRHSLELELQADDISQGQPIALSRTKEDQVFALYYPPTNKSQSARNAERPPLIVTAHGGPTGMAERGLKPRTQYWTSRGFAVLDVDYRGSWGYGRSYRDSLNGHWGIRDVEDVVTATEMLVKKGLVDGRRKAITGSSAGGFTVLCALAFTDVFQAGVSSYGVGDLEQLLRETHKFESGYLYALTGTTVGATDAVFRARSPLQHAHKIKAPVMFFQGAEDKIVPPDQSRSMVEQLKDRGVPVGYMEFEGEGHGFRGAKAIVAALLAEHAFYARVFKLRPAESLPRLTLFNEENLT
ncbi:dipeptidyl aminopeptidase/acylaminoacyl peptidase [Rhodoligotrophos appendicifer]|uniref:S9 family peptidase n=1 Tax=Rhodoligotrophos appendicifer TaxID=987056 RepID=UPI0014783EB5|nr:prolyl oligopeptidase family serine peptidase [Rhodoligotrophos appendicifer]